MPYTEDKRIRDLQLQVTLLLSDFLAIDRNGAIEATKISIQQLANLISQNVIKQNALDGTVAPDNALGVDGDFYFRKPVDNSALQMYQKISGVWVSVFNLDLSSLLSRYVQLSPPTPQVGSINVDAEIRANQFYTSGSRNFIGSGYFQSGSNDDGLDFGVYYGNKMALRNAGSTFATTLNVSNNVGSNKDIIFPDATGTVALFDNAGKFIIPTTPETDATPTQILTLDATTKEVKKIDASSLSPSLTFNNGLTKTGNVIKLGGELTEDVTVIGTTNPDDDGVYTLYVNGETNKAWGGGARLNDKTANNGMTVNETESKNDFGVSKDGVGGLNIKLSTINGAILDDNLFNKGLSYLADYSANFTARSLIDRGSADARYAILSGGNNFTGDTNTFKEIVSDLANGGSLLLKRSGANLAFFSTTQNVLGSGSTSDLNTYLFGNNPYAVWTNGVKRYSVDGVGQHTFTGAIAGTSASFAGDVNTDGIFRLNGNAFAINISDIHAFFGGLNGFGVLKNDGSDYNMLIKNNGNVLIGTTTDDGVNKLQVNGSATVQTNAGTAKSVVRNEDLPSGFETAYLSTGQTLTANTPTVISMTGATQTSNGGVDLLDLTNNIVTGAVNDVILLDVALPFTTPAGTNNFMTMIIRVKTTGTVYRAITHSILKGTGNQDYLTASFSIPYNSDAATNGLEIIVDSTVGVTFNTKFISATRVHKNR